jgi:hypothetical protein
MSSILVTASHILLGGYQQRFRLCYLFLQGTTLAFQFLNQLVGLGKERRNRQKEEKEEKEKLHKL